MANSKSLFRLNDVITMLLIFVFTFLVGTCVSTCEKHYNDNCINEIEQRGYKVDKIEQTFFLNGPFFPVKDAKFYRIETDKGIVYARCWFGGWTFRKDTGEEIPE